MIILLKELHFVASNCGEEVIAREAKLKADSLTPEGLNIHIHTASHVLMVVATLQYDMDTDILHTALYYNYCNILIN